MNTAAVRRGARTTPRVAAVAHRARSTASHDAAPLDLRFDLIGPPCPLSNLRPVYYAALFPPLPTATPSYNPYSLSEFPSSSLALDRKQQRLQRVKRELQSEDLEWRLTRYRVDAFNQDFWARTNTAFLLARDAYLDDNPSPADTPVDLAPFYAQHLASTREQYAAYNRRLWGLQASLLWPALKAGTRPWKWRWEVWKAGGDKSV